jgi:hypothetical protein
MTFMTSKQPTSRKNGCEKREEVVEAAAALGAQQNIRFRDQRGERNGSKE